jgi:hypothetical protein
MAIGRLAWTVLMSALVSCSLLTTAWPAEPSLDSPPVKRSRSGVCHPKGERGYEHTSYFIAFGSLDDCLQNGGRMPGQKGSKGNASGADDKAAYDTDDQQVIKKSRSGVCHDQHSPSFPQIEKYTAYRTMQDCLDSGGRPIQK